MKTSLSMLFAPAVLTVAFGLPAFAGMRPSGDVSGDGSGLCVYDAVFEGADQTAPLIWVSGDDDDGGSWARRSHHDDDDDCDDDDGDDHECKGTKGTPAPAGAVKPPTNGLFGNGAPPVVVTN